MTDLDRQVAEAQGWKYKQSDAHAFYDAWVDEKGIEQWAACEYTPSIDLNQAAAFAEWAIMREQGANEYECIP